MSYFKKKNYNDKKTQASKGVKIKTCNQLKHDFFRRQHQRNCNKH